MSIGQHAATVTAWPLGDGRSIAEHRHRWHQLSIASRSSLAVAAGGRIWVLPRSRGLWIPAGFHHSIDPIGPAAMTAVWIDPARCRLDWAQPTVVAVDDLALQLVDRLAGSDLDDGARQRTESVLFDVLQPLDADVLDLPMPADDRARAVAEALLADPTDNRTLVAWGRSIGASERTLMRGFRSGTGLGFHEWRTRARLLAAVQMLIAGEPVTVVAGKVGYSTTSGFSAAFARELGVPPSTYRGGPVNRSA